MGSVYRGRNFIVCKVCARECVCPCSESEKRADGVVSGGNVVSSLKATGVSHTRGANGSRNRRDRILHQSDGEKAAKQNALLYFTSALVYFCDLH